MLGDEVMAAALIDRLVHHCHIASGRLPDEGSSEPAAVRLGIDAGKEPPRDRRLNGDRSGDTRPLWITGLSPPDSWRSLRQPGYLQLDQVRHPKHRVWGYDRTSKKIFNQQKWEIFSRN